MVQLLEPFCRTFTGFSSGRIRTHDLKTWNSHHDGLLVPDELGDFVSVAGAALNVTQDERHDCDDSDVGLVEELVIVDDVAAEEADALQVEGQVEADDDALEDVAGIPFVFVAHLLVLLL